MGVVAAARQRPFDDSSVQVLSLSGGRLPTVAEVLERLDVSPGFRAACEARVNGELVPRGCWHLVRCRPTPGRDLALTFTLPLQGGGGGGGTKNTVAILATIAVLVAAAAVSAGALGPSGLAVLGAGVPFFGAGSTAANLAAAAITIGGTLAVAALTPPPSLAATPGQAPALSDDPNRTASLSGNALAPGAPVPRVIGTHRVFPPPLCNALIELVGDTEYAEAVYGLAGPHLVQDVRSGGVDLDSISEVDYEVQDGLPGGSIQTLVERQGQMQLPNTELSGHKLKKTSGTSLDIGDGVNLTLPQWHTFITKVAPDEFWVDSIWPEGLFKNDATTTQINQPVRVRFRLRGTSTWHNCPEVHFSQNKPGVFQKSIRLVWTTAPSALVSIGGSGGQSHGQTSESGAVRPNQQGPILAFKHVPANDNPGSAGGWDADSYFSAGAGSDAFGSGISPTNVINMELYGHKAVFYLDPATFPQGVYEVQVMRGYAYLNSNFVPATYAYSAAVEDFFGYRGTGTIQVDQSQLHSRILVQRASSVWNQNPIQSTDFATISVVVHNRGLGELSVLASGYIHDAAGNWVTSSNPATNFREVLTGTLGSRPVDPALVEDLSAWETRCGGSPPAHEVNAVTEGHTYLDVLNMIASRGKGRPRHSELWGVAEDRDRTGDTPVQIFNPRNSRGFTWTKAFADRPSGLRVNFNDSDNDYQSNGGSLIVYDNPERPDAGHLESISYDGLVTAAEAEEQAAFDLLQSKKRLTFYKFTTDLEALVATRSDLIGVQHDTLARQAGFARIKQVVLNSSGQVSGLVLEGTIPLSTEDAWSDTAAAWSSYSLAWLPGRAGLAIRLKDGAGVSTHEVVLAGVDQELTVVNFTTPFADPGASLLDVDCLCSSGPLTEEYRRLIVFGVLYNQDLSADVVAVDEAPELFA